MKEPFPGAPAGFAGGRADGRRKEETMKTYESIHLVKSEDLNHHGTLYAARAAAWFVEAGFVAAAGEHGDTGEVVLRSLSDMSFSRPVREGEMVVFRSRVAYAGHTSLVVHVEAADLLGGEIALEGYVTYVVVDARTRQKKLHNIVLDDPVNTEECRQRAVARQKVKT